MEVLRAANLANLLFAGPVWIAGQAIGFAEAFNAYAFVALVLSGTAAFILLDRLRFGVLAAAFGAYVFAFNPNHIDKAFGHAPLAATGILPFVLLALLAKRQRPTRVRAAGAGLLLAVAFYLNSYLGLFAFFLAAVFAVVDYTLRREGVSRYQLVRSYYFLALAFVIGLIPLGVSWYFDPSSVSSLSGARSEVFHGGSASAELYLLPGPRHPLLGGPMSEWLETNLSWEYTMFFGYTTIALARRRSRPRVRSGPARDVAPREPVRRRVRRRPDGRRRLGLAAAARSGRGVRHAAALHDARRSCRQPRRAGPAPALALRERPSARRSCSVRRWP